MWPVHSQHRFARRLGRVALVALSLAFARGVRAECMPMFIDKSLSAWTVTPTETQRGDATADVQVSVVDGSKHKTLPGKHPFDESTIQLVLSAAAGLDGGTGSAEAKIELTAIIIAFERYLQFVVGGGFEHQFIGAPGKGLEFEVEVQGACGSINHVIYNDIAKPTAQCGLGLSVLGTLDADPPTITLDLFEAGMIWGEYIAVTVRARTVATTLAPCQLAVSQAVIFIDGFTECPDPLAADLNGDGRVTGIDLAMLLGAWGSCDCPASPCCPCPADLNNSLTVDGLDLAELLAAWG